MRYNDDFLAYNATRDLIQHFGHLYGWQWSCIIMIMIMYLSFFWYHHYYHHCHWHYHHSTYISSSSTSSPPPSSQLYIIIVICITSTVTIYNSSALNSANVIIYRQSLQWKRRRTISQACCKVSVSMIQSSLHLLCLTSASIPSHFSASVSKCILFMIAWYLYRYHPSTLSSWW